MTLTEFCARAETVLRADAPLTWDHSDDDMNQKARMIPDGLSPVPAAVLVGVLENGGASVLLTERKATLSKHGGQIAFPGGRIDKGESPLEAALREAWEETRLDPRFVTPLGYLDGYLTVTGYFVVPVVARIDAGYHLSPHADEVEDIFDVPLAFLLDPSNRQTHAREWKGLQRHYHVYPYGARYIWGATAGMIKNLADRIDNAGK